MLFTYRLDKLSDPGFTLQTDDLHLVYTILRRYFTNYDCKIMVSENHTHPDDLHLNDLIDLMLSEPRGAEFMMVIDGDDV